MPRNTKAIIFAHYRDRLSASGLPTTHSDSLICPLCWQEVRIDNLSIEHTIPGSVGGTQEVLTCRRCNNNQGASLDSALARYQTIADAFRGHGVIRSDLTINGKHLSSNLDWSEKTFKIVKKANDPRIERDVIQDLEAGRLDQINLTLAAGYNKNQFETAVVRAAYLALFKKLDYKYAKHSIVQILRRKICDPSLESPRIGSLLMRLEDVIVPHDKPYWLSGGSINNLRFMFVILRIKKVTRTNIGVFMPHPASDPGFFELIERYSREFEEAKIHFSGNVTR